MIISNQEKSLKILMKNAKVISRDTVGVKDIQNAFKIINNPIPDYNELTYFFRQRI